MDGTSTASTGNVLQCLTTRSEEFLPIIQSKLIIVHFEATIPCPITVKSPPPDFFRFPSLVKGGSKITQEPSLLQIQQPQLSQPFPIEEVFHPPNYLHGSLLDLFQHVHILFVLRKVDTVHCKSGAEEKN